MIFLHKNRLPFGDCNLLQHKLRQLKKVPQLEQIVVSSEDDEMLRMAETEGVTAMKRPEEYARRECSFGLFVHYIASQVTGDEILWTCVTSPFVDENTYEKAITIYDEKRREGYDSLITVQPHKCFMLDRNGSLNFKRGLKHPYSEQLPELYLYTSGIALAPRLKMIEWNYHWGHIPYMYVVDKRTGMEITDEFDYRFAKYLLTEEKA